MCCSSSRWTGGGSSTWAAPVTRTDVGSHRQARNLLMTLGDRQQPSRFLLHDRDSKSPVASTPSSKRGHQDRTKADPGERERLRRALGAHTWQRVPQPDPDLQPSTPRPRASRLQPPQQRAQAAPLTWLSCRPRRRRPRLHPPLLNHAESNDATCSAAFIHEYEPADNRGDSAECPSFPTGLNRVNAPGMRGTRTIAYRGVHRRNSPAASEASTTQPFFRGK